MKRLKRFAAMILRRLAHRLDPGHDERVAEAAARKVIEGLSQMHRANRLTLNDL